MELNNNNAVIQYVVTNHSHKVHLLKMRSIQGIVTSGCELQLGYKQSCVLNLLVIADQIKKDIIGGPVLCDQANANQCYQPGEANILRIKRSFVIQPTLNLSTSVLNLILGGSYQTILVSNTSTIDVENLNVSIPGNSAVTLDPAHTTCTNTLPAGAQCQYAFLPGISVESGTVITISGSNTSSPSTVTVNVSEVVITLSSDNLSFPVGSLSPILTVTNTSLGTPVTNLQILNLPSNLTLDGGSTCTIGGTLSAGGTCTFIFSATAPVPATTVTIQGSNSNAQALTLTATTPPTLSVTSPTSNAILDTDGSSTLPITVENTGGSDALNVTMSSPSWTGVTFTPTSCGTIIAGGSCTFTINSNTPNLAKQITIQGSNTGPAITTPYIAFRFQGGLVFSVGPANTAKVVTEDDVSVNFR